MEKYQSPSQRLSKAFDAEMSPVKKLKDHSVLELTEDDRKFLADLKVGV